MLASGWPLTTRSPALAGAAVTWPAAPKLSVALFFGSMVPVADRLWLSVIRTTGTMLVTVPGEPLGRVRNQAAAAAPSSTTAATGSAIRGRRHNVLMAEHPGPGRGTPLWTDPHNRWSV